MFKKRVLLIGLVILTAGLVSVLYSRGLQGQNTANSLVGGMDIYRVPMPLEAQVKKADSIALVTVEKVGPPQWNIPGIDSLASLQKAIQRGESPYIFRPITLRVERYLKNPQKESMLTIYQMGGELYDVAMHSPQELEFQEGMKVVIFLERQRPPSPIDWGFSWAYVINGDTAYGVWDKESLPVDKLLSASVVTE